MKFCLLVIVFLCFLSLGVFIYLRYYFRYVLFKDLTYICKSLKNNITFKKDKISVLIDKACSNVSRVSKNVIVHKSSNLFVNSKQDIEVVNEFINSLGNGDVQYELNNIAYYESNFEELKQTSKELLNKNGVMYIKLMIGIGLGICIMLL